MEVPIGTWRNMAQKYINQVAIASTSSEKEEDAVEALYSRSLLYNRDRKDLNIVLENSETKEKELVPLTQADEFNVTKNDQNKIALKDDIQVKSITTTNGPINWKSQTPIATTSDGHYILLLCKQDTEGALGKAIIGGEIIEAGDGVYSHYQISVSSSGSRLLKGASTAEKRAKLVLCKYNGTYYYGIKFSSGLPAVVSFAGWTSVEDAVSAPDFSSYTDGDMSETIELDSDSDTGTQVIDYVIVSFTNHTWEFNTDDSTLNVSGNHANYSLGDGLILTSSKTTILYYNGTTGNNKGYINVSNSGEDFSLAVLGKCTVTVGALSSNSSNARTVTITGSDGTISGTAAVSGSSFCSETSYTKTTSGQETITISHSGGGIRYAYIKLVYSETGATAISSYIDQLPETGEDGSPHIIRMSGEITRNDVLAIAEKIRESSNKQIILDLSECTMESSYTDWTADTETTWYDPTSGAKSCLSAAFYNCVGLRAFYYPKNVTTSGGHTFQNCTFLRECHFNAEMINLGAAGAWSPTNNSLFAGARLKTIFIPKSVTTLTGYPFSSSNIVNIYIERGSTLTAAKWSGQWNTWSQVKEAITMYIPDSATITSWASEKDSGNNYKPHDFTGADGDGIEYLSTSDYIKDHLALWENYDILEDPEFDLDYTA